MLATQIGLSQIASFVSPNLHITEYSVLRVIKIGPIKIRPPEQRIVENIEIIHISLPQNILQSRKNKQNATDFADSYPQHIPIPNLIHVCRVLLKSYTYYSRDLQTIAHARPWPDQITRIEFLPVSD